MWSLANVISKHKVINMLKADDINVIKAGLEPRPDLCSRRLIRYLVDVDSLALRYDVGCRPGAEMIGVTRRAVSWSVYEQRPADAAESTLDLKSHYLSVRLMTSHMM